ALVAEPLLQPLRRASRPLSLRLPRALVRQVLALVAAEVLAGGVENRPPGVATLAQEPRPGAAVGAGGTDDRDDLADVPQRPVADADRVFQDNRVGMVGIDPIADRRVRLVVARPAHRVPARLEPAQARQLPDVE